MRAENFVVVSKLLDPIVLLKSLFAYIKNVVVREILSYKSALHVNAITSHDEESMSWPTLGALA